MDIGIDFDGTVVTHEFPEVGQPIGAQPVLERLVDEGHRLVLFTMRSNGQEHGSVLDDAVQWFDDRDIPLYGVQENPNNNWSDSPKAYANLYIDDSALGCPLVEPFGRRPFVDWNAVESSLISRGVLSGKAVSKEANRILESLNGSSNHE